VSRPIVTVGLPTYNGARYLEATLESLLAQDLDDVEIVISDNGSTDATEQICREFAVRSRSLRYERAPQNRGAAWNYNRVLGMASAPYFKWAADDDVCEPTFLRRCVEVLEAAPRAVVAFPQTRLIDGDGREIGPLDDVDLDLRGADPIDRLARLLRHRLEWHPVFGVIRTDVLRDTRGIGAFVLADVAVLAELALRGEFHQVPEQLFLRRYHDERSVVANPSFEAHAAWYDPNRSRRGVWPQARLVRELLVRTREAPLPATSRGRAAAEVLRCWALPQWRLIGGEARLALARRAGGRPKNALRSS
jgi:glycosyltransferase involved in cell wall biosynthesis